MSLMQIKHRWTNTVLFDGDFTTMKVCIEAARKKSADLRGADLRGAGLRGAYLHGAALGGADLRGADLRGVALGGADLRGAALRGAGLRGADLRGAYLHGAALHGAALRGAKIKGDVTLAGRPLRRALRDDGYEFYLWPTDAGVFVQAGCRWFTFDKAWAHWCGAGADRLNTPLGDESHDILVMFSLALDRMES